jgi:glyoxylase-like metal-dependent hydrolase (beta-lactamase superfamily II)
VPHHVVPRARVPAAPFEWRVVCNWKRWREVALWWPEARVLVCADALGTVAYFVARRERLGVHPLLRAMPPRAAFEGLTPSHVLCGHGEGVHDDATAALHEALATARRRVPALLLSIATAGRA